MGAKLFVIDGSPAVRRMVEQVSATEGYEVHTFQDGPSALQAAKKLAPRTVIADFHLDKITFSSFCKELVKLDNMADASIISLVDSSDKVDEKVYKSLGVAIFLTKPLEPGNLIETLRDLAAKQAKKTGAAKVKRTWPPVSTFTDLDEEDEGQAQDLEEISNIQEPQEPPQQPQPRAPSPQPPQPASVVPPAVNQPGPAHLETASKTLIDAMTAGVIPQVTHTILSSLPALIGREVEQVLAARLDQAIQKQTAQALSSAVLTETIQSIVRRDIPDLISQQVASQLGSVESTLLPRLEEKVTPLIQRTAEEAMNSRAEGLVEKSLPKVVRDQIGTIDRLVMNTVQDLAGPQVRETVDKVARELVQDQVTKAVREQMGSINRLVVNTVQDLARPQVREAIEQVVQETTRDHVARAVREIVPAVAETQVTEEIKRLSAQA